ncbi:MAG: GatB/YqeY domain-containing protein [Deltaproteobacteria bacterium]|nr:GatB/YqeY domain-containing protein [Deltaproteobacteria bacterium]
MPLREDLINQMNQAAKSQNKGKLGTLRFILAAVKNKEIELKKRESGLSDEEIIYVISSMIKQRLDSIEQFQKGGREDLVQKELAELAILKTFMPPQLSREEVITIVEQTAVNINAAGLRDMGRLMKEVMPKLIGKADGKLISDAVKEVLASLQH